MRTEVEPSDWACLDQWWSAYARNKTIDQGSAVTPVLKRGQLTNSWDELDPWWGVYTETGDDIADPIAKLLARSNDEWAKSSGPFDTDPLAADLTMSRLSRGPIQPVYEMGWSRWLARLLQPSAELVTELFDVEVDQNPDEVLQEDPISGRRPDILVFYNDCGISVEVKKGDRNYQKTAETATLVEEKYDGREWSHTLLLSKGNVDRLRSRVDAPVKRRSNDQFQIEWNEPGPVSVIFWRDVTAAIRSILLRDEAVDDHWAANAYLFCAAAEQRILDFQPQSVVKQLTASENVVDTLHPIMLADTLKEQLTYLRARRET